MAGGVGLTVSVVVSFHQVIPELHAALTVLCRALPHEQKDREEAEERRRNSLVLPIEELSDTREPPCSQGNRYDRQSRANFSRCYFGWVYLL